jgi:transketolase
MKGANDLEKLEGYELELVAQNCRENVIRMVKASGHGHIGGAFSAMDIVTALYFRIMNIDPKQPKKDDRDRFVLSAGHKCMVQYAVLAERGFVNKEILDTYGKLHSTIPGHPDMYKLAGIEANTGALGHGLAIGTGMALGLKSNRTNSKVYVVLGDGELAEGSNWEAAAAASHHKVDNLVAIVDYNGLQISGKVEDVMNMTPIADHFKAFGWSVKDIDGNNMKEIVETLEQIPLEAGKPTLIVAHTIKCKGLSLGENVASYHYWSPTLEELQKTEDEMKRNKDRLVKKIEEEKS